MKVIKVQGQFQKFNGTFSFDKKTKTISDVKLIIDTHSVFTNETKRDKHLRTSDFFHSQIFPKIFFQSNKLIYKNGNPHQLNGQMIFKNKKFPLSFILDFKGLKTDPWKKESLFITGKTTLRRSQIGLKWNKILDQGGFLLGDEVRVNFVLEANKTTQKPPFSRFLIPQPNLTNNSYLAQKPFSCPTPKAQKCGEVTPSNENHKSTPPSSWALIFILGFLGFLLVCICGYLIKSKLWSAGPIFREIFEDGLIILLSTAYAFLLYRLITH